MADPVAFLEEYVVSHGGMVERSDSRLQLLAPRALEGLPELAEFWVRPESPPESAEPLYLGHPYLTRVLELARTEGMVAFRHLPKSATHRPGLELEIRRALGFRNARLELDPAIPGCVPWLRFHYRVTASWDEKREELVTIGMDLQTGLPVDLAVLDRTWLEPGRLPGVSMAGLAEAYETSLQHLQRCLAPRIQSFARQSQRHLELELQKLDSYYDGAVTDLHKRIRRASAERRPGLESKLEQARRDRAARRSDLEAKFRIKVVPQLSCLEVIGVPRLTARAVVKTKKGTASFPISYNFLTHQVDPIACSACRQGGYAFYLCGESHLVCTACARECTDCRRIACPRCSEAHQACCRGEGPSLESEAPAQPSRPATSGRGNARAPAPRLNRDAPGERTASPPPDSCRTGSHPGERASAPPGLNGRPGLLLQTFAPFLNVYDNLDQELAEPDRLVASGQTRRAGETLERLLREVNPEAVQLKKHLRQVSRILLRERPQKALLALEELAGPAAEDGAAGQAVALIHRLTGERRLDPAVAAAAVRLLRQCKHRLDRRKGSESWAAAAVHIVASASDLERPDEFEVAGLFGISDDTLYRRSGELFALARTLLGKSA
ncbi:MAG: hypothetical protein HY319_16870 [Armatimonadetes bacterium]|nr:hypothetical protein [Armatimonadota bacterium]